MAPSSEKDDREVSITENVELVDDDRSEDYRMMSRRILLKLDLQVLPPLALVSSIANSYHNLIIEKSLEAMARKLH